MNFWGDIVNLKTTTAAKAPCVGNDDEAVVDLGKTSSTIHTNFEKEELESHRAVYVGVHVPLGRETKRRHHRHRGHRHHPLSLSLTSTNKTLPRPGLCSMRASFPTHI
ncbi:sodium bicarbonate cotransporter 3-like [Salvelinus sp. IW2-2015]|uniref:sodium bicarbonate cotransporter 3-like n=1 Tax=Salvelinus sp. IW2-2015 TaxID=2691554 RepID=UPI0038D4B3D7